MTNLLSDHFPTCPPDERGRLHPTHEFFTGTDFWDRLFFVSEVVAPTDTAFSEPLRLEIGDSLDRLDLVFLHHVIAGNVQAAYDTLLDRFRVTGHVLDDEGHWFSGDEVGPATLGQCLEFAAYWGIQDQRFPKLLHDYELLGFVYDFERGIQVSEEDLNLNENQLSLF